ncbi:flagellar filament capping protein FliD [Salinisphaera sp. LB1]|uniref:flagellar filament capping protein FliD n=1 Tax=Salinisphaera sp. LB1 TaxID=2183911 RepID=UPI000D7059B1|nr:flagellar filament capping protein FliD [Salinisphaera sp. LB1]
MSSSSYTPTLSSLGVGSGLNLSSLLDGLKSSEQTRLQPLQTREASYKSQLSAYGTLTSAVKNLQGAADKLNDPSLYNSTKVDVAGSAVTASSSTSAVPGSYNVSVSQLAQAQSLVASPVADKTANIGAGGTISITTGSNSPVKIDLANGKSSLADIRDAINNANAGVSASIINDGSATPYRLVLSSDASGTANQITVSATDASGASGTPLANLLSYNSSNSTGNVMTQTVAAQDAKLSVNGIAISRSSNTVNDAIQGVTLNLNATTTSPDQVTTTRDNNTIKGAIKNFVSAYNSYQGKVSSLTAFNGSSPSNNGVLLGDSTVRSVESQVNKVLNTPVSGGSLSTLSDLGISLQTDGTLKIDNENKLDTALASDPHGVAQLFSGDPSKTATTDGVAGMLSTAIGNMTDKNGLLSSASKGVQNSIDDVKKSMTDMQKTIDATVARYQQQFVQLDSLMSSLNSTKSYLTTQLSQLNPSSSSSKG